MSQPDPRFPTESEPEAPQALKDGLAALFAPGPRVPRHRDEAVLAEARRRLGRGGRLRRVVRWGAVAAAAAVALFAIRFTLNHREPATAPRATRTAPAVAKARPALKDDINGDGRADILDAFALARALDANRRPQPDWDVNGDGRIDRRDVDSVAMAAVSLNRGILQ